VWLLAEPQALKSGENGKVPLYEGALTLEEGPERIESGWWDGKDVARDYYVARNPVGVRLWVYRERGRSGTASRCTAGSCMASLAEPNVCG
jgi:protein ImuB